ncbi:MAG: hypothetical protein MK135_03785 [Polyangiaceae bacterium]|nr:hypothetical protein [Polyangiaceae bacterium]
MPTLAGVPLAGKEAIAHVWPEGVLIDVSASENWPSTFVVGPSRVVSSEVAELIKDVVPQSEFELLPVEVLFHGERRAGYSVLRPLCFLDALDREASVFTMSYGVIDQVDKVVLNWEIVGNARLFMLDSLTPVVCVSDLLAAQFARFDGVWLVEPKDWKRF